MPGSRSLRSLARGIRVALATPSHIEHRLPALLAWSRDNAVVASDPTAAITTAHRALRILARIPGGPWRNTCLYRGAAECLLLRAHGVAARLSIGVESRPHSAPGVEAHAWVETDAERVAPRSAPPTPATVRLTGSRQRHPSRG
ncbi:MAG: lasso peptide biosynthesis B2 protein [Gemmatimonadota bacterium]|nr:lasso peptide biosynthesis B2 protein [Gemmatimonadota bacterium]